MREMHSSFEFDNMPAGQIGAGIELVNGTQFGTNDKVPRVTYNDNVFSLDYAGSAIVPEFSWQVRKEKEVEAFNISLTVKNTTEASLPIEKIILFSTSVIGEDIHASVTGWETQSPTHPPLPLSRHERLLGIAKRSPSRVGPIILSETDAVDPIPEMTQIIDSNGRNMLIGFTTEKDKAGFITIESGPSQNIITAFNAAEGITILPGESMSSERLLISFEKDPVKARHHYAENVAKEMQAKVLQNPEDGWCSWYEFGWNVDEDKIKKNVDALEKLRDKIPVKNIVTDDYFAPDGKDRIGDWLKPTEKFPSGFKDMNDYIHEKGFKSVLWLAPFIASSKSELYKEHPDWFVMNKNNAPINVKDHWGTENFALDMTNEEVQNHMRNLMRDINDAGFDGIKIDFLFLGTQRGERNDPKATGISALRQGLTIIDEEMQDKFVLHCGGPMLPLVGYASLHRVGPDVGTSWIDTSHEGTWPSMKYAQRSTWARKYMDGNFYTNDPDCILMRKNNSGLTDAERASWLTTVALHRVALLGDDMTRFETEQLPILSHIFPPLATGEKAVPIKFDDEGMATKVHMKVERPWESWNIATMYNWKDEEENLVFKPQDWGLDDGKKYHIFDQWEGKYLGAVQDELILSSTPSHGVKVLSVHDDKGRPQVVGSTMHLLGNAYAIEEESWEDNKLNISFRGGKEGEVTVYVPEGYEFDRENEREGRVVKVKVIKDMASVSLTFTATDPMLV